MSRNKEGKENNDGDEEGEVDGVVEEDQGEEYVVEDKNCLMDFVLELEYVADEDGMG
jgi:predicted RecB family endonuclease